MPAAWYPIAPVLTDAGAFAALAHLPDAQQYVPVPESLTVGNRFGRQDVFEGVESLSVFSTLGITGIASVTASLTTLAAYRDVTRFHEAIAPASNIGPIRGTLWGAGFRLTLTVSDIQIEGSLTMPWAAAATELGIANSSYELRAFGLVDPALLGSMPVTGRFDTAALSAIRDTELAVRTFMAQHTDRLVAQPFMVLMDELPVAPVMTEARGQLFAMKQIRNGRTLEESLARAKSLDLHRPTIRRVYSRIAPGGPDATPSHPAQGEAKQWLDQYKA